ncbi:MAG: hypothetical protein WCW35_01520 [Bacteroidota bacterium]|jgi:hypothetical protein
MKNYSYFVLLQQNSSASRLSEDSFEEYKNFIPLSLQSVAAEFQRKKSEAIQKNGSILRGGLAHFLSTPLKSDTEEIIRLIQDSIENTVQQLDAAPMLSTVEHSLWKVLEPQEVPLQRQLVGVVKRLLKNGRTMLVNAGCTFGKNSGEIGVSLFLFNGFSTVQSLKSIIDNFSSRQVLSVVNGSVNANAIAIERDIPPEKNLIVIDFNYPDDSILDVLNQRLPVLLDQFGITHCTFTKQLLHSAVGAAYQIRFGLNVHKHPLGSVILSLVGDHVELENAVTTNGSLIVLEQLP